MKANTALALKTSFNIASRPSLIIGSIYILLLVFIGISRGYHAIDFVHLGTVWSEHTGNAWGYDGQFYYQLARDPFHAYAFMDDAPYRYQRIFYPLVVALLSLGNSSLVPYMMLFVNWLAIVLSVEIVARMLVRQGLSPWFSLPVGLYFGQLAAFSFDTAEPLSLGLICAGVWMVERKRIWRAAVLMGLAALSREVTVVFAGGYAFWFLVSRQWRHLLAFILLGIAPIIAWLFCIVLIFGRTGVTFTPPFEHVPFQGIFFFAQTPRKFPLLVVLMLIPTLGGCLFAGWQIRHLWTKKSWQLLVLWLIWLANLWMVVFLSHFSYIEVVSCGRIASALVLSGLLYGVLSRQRIVLWGMHYYTFTSLIFALGIILRLDSFIM